MPTPAPRVILCHGLWMPTLAMLKLAHQFSAAGWIPVLFEYSTTRDPWEHTLQRLHDLVEEQGTDGVPVHLVGHSLGGLLAVRYLQTFGPLPHGGRAVCLGSPLLGSHTARQLARHLWGRVALGVAATWLHTGVGACPNHTPVAMIAGCKPSGAGQMLDHLWQLQAVKAYLQPAVDVTPIGPHDGTVWLSETQAEGLACHLTMDCTHTGLTWNERVALACERFLRGQTASELSSAA